MTWQELCRAADRLMFQTFMNHHDRQGGYMMSHTVISDTINGVDTARLRATVQGVQQNPDLARFQFRTKNEWLNGGHNRSTIRSFYGAGQEDTVRTKPFMLDAAEPPVLLGEDQAANPAEYVLHALAACLTTSLIYHAAARGIRIESVASYLEGDLDVRGFLGTSGEVRKGFQQVRAQFKIKSDAGKEQLQELTRFSPIYDTIANPVAVSISIDSA